LGRLFVCLGLVRSTSNRTHHMPTTTQTTALRINPDNANHHLWNNHGTWWVHYTIHQPDYTKRRVRVSLETRSRNEARQRRDTLFAHLEAEGVGTA